MDTHEHILFTEMGHRTKHGERWGQIARELAEARQQRCPTVRKHTAALLIVIADRLNPDAVLAFEANKPQPHT